jgi:hypothetical protein
MSSATKMSAAFAIADQLRQAREQLQRHDLYVRLGRVERDAAWRDDLLDVIRGFERSLDRLVRCS